MTSNANTFLSSSITGLQKHSPCEKEMPQWRFYVRVSISKICECKKKKISFPLEDAQEAFENFVEMHFRKKLYMELKYVLDQNQL